MPSYAFKCQDCQERFELEISLDEREELKPSCPVCGSEDVVQTFDRIGIMGCRTSGKSSSPG